MTGIMIGTTDEAGIVATSGGIVIGTGTAAAGAGALGTTVVAGAPGHAGVAAQHMIGMVLHQAAALLCVTRHQGMRAMTLLGKRGQQSQ